MYVGFRKLGLAFRVWDLETKVQELVFSSRGESRLQDF